AGVVQYAGDLYVRGGRAGEVAYFLDGANITNPLTNTSNFNITPETIEEIQLQTGGMSAELGRANSGVVQTITRSGGPKLKVTLNYLTDDFAKPGQQFAGTSSYGQRVGALTLGGPLFSGVRFFLAGHHDYIRNRQVMFLEPFKFTGLTDDGLSVRKVNPLTGKGDSLPGPFEFKENYIPNNWNLNNSANGNLIFDLEQLVNMPLKVRLSGYYSFSKSPQGSTWIDLAPVATGVASNYFRLDRIPMNETNTGLANLRVTHIISPTTFYELGVSYNYRKSVTFDPAFEDNYLSYMDSVANAKKGYTGFKNRYEGPNVYSTIFKFLFNAPNTPNNSYSKEKQTGLGFTLDFTTQTTKSWELKAGGSLDTWTMRTFSIGDIANYLIFLDPNRDGVIDQTFANEYEKRVRLLRSGNIATYGYDYLGNETGGYTLSGSSATLDPPYKPIFASAYVQNKVEYKDLILNIGVRYEYYDPK
ncbi:MAG: TonB-dependent receptor, partial [Bacteroidota bacterium]